MVSKNILLVDDESKIRELLKIYLEKEGFSTCQAADGQKALEMLRQNSYHLIILDLMMPGRYL